MERLVAELARLLLDQLERPHAPGPEHEQQEAEQEAERAEPDREQRLRPGAEHPASREGTGHGDLPAIAEVERRARVAVTCRLACEDGMGHPPGVAHADLAARMALECAAQQDVRIDGLADPAEEQLPPGCEGGRRGATTVDGRLDAEPRRESERRRVVGTQARIARAQTRLPAGAIVEPDRRSDRDPRHADDPEAVERPLARRQHPEPTSDRRMAAGGASGVGLEPGCGHDDDEAEPLELGVARERTHRVAPADELRLGGARIRGRKGGGAHHQVLLAQDGELQLRGHLSRGVLECEAGVRGAVAGDDASSDQRGRDPGERESARSDGPEPDRAAPAQTAWTLPVKSEDGRRVRDSHT